LDVVSASNVGARITTDGVSRLDLYTTCGGNTRNWGLRTSKAAEGDFSLMRSTSAGGDPSAHVLYANKDGNVGIAMTNPSVALDVTGDIEYTGTITDVSDQRLKENIVGINNPISKIQGINGVYFNMIGSDKRELGVIAQNVQQVLPEAVSIVDPENGYLGVDYTSLVPVLIEAIKEQQRQIQALRQDIEQLERNL